MMMVPMAYAVVQVQVTGSDRVGAALRGVNRFSAGVARPLRGCCYERCWRFGPLVKLGFLSSLEPVAVLPKCMFPGC